MSESGFPFGPRDATELLSVDELGQEPSSGGRPPVLLLGAGALVAALGAAAAVFLWGGGEDPATEVLPSSSAGRLPAVAAPVEAAPSPAALPAPNTESFARNPFKAQYVEPQAAPAAAAPSPVSVSVPLPLPSGSPLPLDLGGVTPKPSEQAEEPEPVVVEYPITLARTAGPAAGGVLTWSVDGEDVEVVPGQRFGRYGELVVLAFATKQGTQEVTGALLQVGDATPFVVSFGETVKVL